MDFDKLKLEPIKCNKKTDSKKVEHTEINPKLSQKPNDRPKNKIERPKINLNEPPRNKIERSKIDLNRPSRNKIELTKINLNEAPRNKIERSKIDLSQPSRNEIKLTRINLNELPRNIIKSHRINSKNELNLNLQPRLIKTEVKSLEFIQKDFRHSSNLKNKLDLEKVKTQLKNIEWENISDDWNIITRSNQYTEYKKYPLDPKKDVSKENPLYRHKDWLNEICSNKDWKLNDKDITKICGVHPTVIGKWRKEHQIPLKLRGEGKWKDERSGKVYIRVPRDDNNPRSTDNSGRKNIYKLEHIHNIEQYLLRNPDLEISKKFLVDNKYLKFGTEVHHINQNGQDNRIKNLWIYESKKEHAKGELTLYKSLKTLVNTNYIQFRNGKYFINNYSGSLKARTSEMGLEKKNLINYKDINLVKKEIKKIDWNQLSNDWIVQINKNQFAQKIVKVDPTQDPSKENPLYRHKEWLKRIVNDDRFNLTDSRLAKLCGITRDTARYWRDKKHKIKGKTEWGFKRRVDDKDGRVWISVPKDYANPVVQKEDHHRRSMLEHRYIMEKHLAKHPELEISKKCLIDGRYLKAEAHVHHINLNYQDNRIENLWVFESDRKHKEATKSLYSLVEKLLKIGKIKFENGKYLTDF